MKYREKGRKYPKMPKGWRSALVQWHVPKRKRPIAYSTKATSDIITTLMGDLTIKELRERITYDVEVKQVLDEYIKRGFGDWICKEHFQRWDMQHAYIPKDNRGFIEVERGDKNGLQR